MGLLPRCGCPSQTVSLIVPYRRREAGVFVQVPVRLTQPQGNGAGRAVAYGFAVHRRYRYTPARRAGQEHLVRAPHLLGRDRSLLERDLVLVRELDDGLARDALEYASGGRSDPPFLYGEDVEARPLDYVVFAVDQDNGLPAVVVSLVEP